MIFKFGNSKKSKTTQGDKMYLALDIGTEYIKSVVFKIVGRDIEIMGYDRSKQQETSMSAAFIMNIEDVIDAVDRSIGNAIKNAEEITGSPIALPSEVIMGIAGELVQGATVVVNVDREHPDKKIDESEVKNIVEKVKKHTFESTKDEIAEEIGIKPSQIEEIDTVINSAYIDSVKVINPVGFTGAELVYRVFSSFAPKLHLDSIKLVAQNLNLDLHSIVVEPYALSLSLQGARESSANAIFIDIGGGTTDIALVQGGDIMGTKMFAIGGRMFTKRLMKDLSLSYDEAESRKIDYTDGKLTGAEEKEVKKAIKKDISSWLTGVQLSLEDFEDVEEFPSEIYLCGGGALLPEIQEGLSAHPWLQVLKFKKYPKVNFLFPNKVKNVIDKTRKATMPGDVTPLALARMILEK